MYAVGLGVILMLMKYLDVAPVVNWAWWWVLSPFVIAFVWWRWADSTGWTKKQAMKRETDRRQARIDRNRDAIGTLNNKRKR